MRQYHGDGGEEGVFMGRSGVGEWYSVVSRRASGFTAIAWLRVGVIVAALVAVVLFALARTLLPSPAGAQALVGKPAPVFTLPAAQDGALLPAPQTLIAQRGHVVLLVFFNTLCTHCLSELQTAHAVASGFPLLTTLAIDAPGERPDITAAYSQRLGFDAPILLDNGARVAARYGVDYYPTLTLVDARGVIRAVWLGEVNASTLHNGIAQIVR
ncbi:MAG: TlpA disulfide reductase family protein [Ktedonobacterales bacterium]